MLRQRVKTCLDETKSKEFVKVLEIFLEKVSDLSSTAADAKAISLAGISSKSPRKAKDDGSSAEEVLSALLQGGLQLNPGSVLKKKSRGARNRATAAVLKANNSMKAVPKADATLTCYGCARKGHARNNCPYADHKHFVKHPNRCKKEFSI
jgi:hypothetical protein